MSATDRRDTVDAATADETLFEAFKKVRRNTELDLRVAAPGTVISYNPLTQTAVVTLGFLPVQEIEVGGQAVEVPEPPVVIPAARVAWVQGATHFDHAPAPISGDTGLLVFCDRALDLWYAAGALPVDPVDGRTHDWADAVFFPGLSPDASLGAPPLNPAARTIEAPIINLGRLASIQPVMRGLIFNGLLTVLAAAEATYGAAIATAITAHAAISPPTAIGNAAFITSLGSAQVALTTAWAVFIATQATWLSTKVFVE